MKRIIFCLAIIFSTQAFALQKNTVFVYDDIGVSKKSLAQTLFTLTHLLSPTIQVKTINANEVKNTDWQKDALLFVMPGGADLPYQQALHGKGNQNIRHFVESGGAYLGICAGGYYGSQKVVFAPGTSMEVIGDRELALYPATAYGPTFGDFDYTSYAGARAATIYWTSHDAFKKGTAFKVYYNGGGYFSDTHPPADGIILARYQNASGKPPAIVMRHVGTGIVILSGVHFEYDYSLLNDHDAFLKPIIQSLKTNQAQRWALAKEILHKLRLLKTSLT